MSNSIHVKRAEAFMISQCPDLFFRAKYNRFFVVHGGMPAPVCEHCIRKQVRRWAGPAANADKIVTALKVLGEPKFKPPEEFGDDDHV